MSITLSEENKTLRALSLLLEYPGPHFHDDLAESISEVSATVPEAGRALLSMAQACKDKTAGQLEEIFTRTFDLAAICSPYVSGYIYGGESYDRGTLMAQFSEKLGDYGIILGGELPDHLKLLLRLAANLSSEELQDLCSFCLLEPVKSMKACLSEDNPYYFLLQAILTLVEHGASGRLRGTYLP